MGDFNVLEVMWGVARPQEDWGRGGLLLRQGWPGTEPAPGQEGQAGAQLVR